MYICRFESDFLADFQEVQETRRYQGKMGMNRGKKAWKRLEMKRYWDCC